MESLNSIPLTTHNYSRNQMHFGWSTNWSKIGMPFHETQLLSEEMRKSLVLERQKKFANEPRPAFHCQVDDIVFLHFKHFGYKSERLGPFKILKIDHTRSECTLLDLRTNKTRISSMTPIIPISLKDCALPLKSLLNRAQIKKINYRIDYKQQ